MKRSDWGGGEAGGEAGEAGGKAGEEQKGSRSYFCRDARTMPGDLVGQ
jgi:hypothetical protein